MKHIAQWNPRRWLLRTTLVGALLTSFFALTSTTIFAAACNPGTPLDASGGSASCDMSIQAIINPGILTLTNDAAAVVPGSPFTLTGAPIAGTFTYTSLVKDHRGSAAGWALSAASAGLKNGPTTIPLTLSALDAASTCTNGACTAPLTFTKVQPLTTTATIYLTAGNAAQTIVVDGEYANKIDGTFTIPAGTPAGTYNGTITITLSNAY